jgi:MoaA/NifB/PqqE/SkfB family radical SAM enzyme
MTNAKRPADPNVTWIEIAGDYQCNNSCVGCFSLGDDSSSMSLKEAVIALENGRKAGATKFWLGGGEPTMRRDVAMMVKAASSLGYETIKLQTNGMMLSYPRLVEKLVGAGLTEVNFAIKGPTAETHDRLTQTPGCFDAMIRGIENIRGSGLLMEGDILVYRSNADEIPEMVRFFHAEGLYRFNLWLMSATDRSDESVRREVPRISETVPHIAAASDLGLSELSDFISSLHTPPCTMLPGYERCLFFAPDLELLVCNPGGYSFMLEESPIEGGLYFPRCDGCDMRHRCGGARADYVEIFGDDEFQPLKRLE